MTSKEHSNKITKEFARMMLVKYAQGQKEHGGKLWENPNLIDEALKEVVDLAFYLMTLKDQIKSPRQDNKLQE